MPQVTGINVSNDGNVSLNTVSGSLSIPELSKLQMSPNASDWHSYASPIITLLGSTNEITLEKAFMALKHNAAPSLASVKYGSAVEDGEVGTVAGLGKVKHLVYNQEHIVINVTEPDHLLYPGIVVRNIYQENGNIYVKTYGVGNDLFGEANNWFAKDVWDFTDSNIKILLKMYEGRSSIPLTLPDAFVTMSEDISNYISQLNEDVVGKLTAYDCGVYLNHNNTITVWFDMDYVDPTKRDLYVDITSPNDVAVAMADGRINLGDVIPAVMDIKYTVDGADKEILSVYIIRKEVLDSQLNGNNNRIYGVSTQQIGEDIYYVFEQGATLIADGISYAAGTVVEVAQIALEGFEEFVKGNFKGSLLSQTMSSALNNTLADLAGIIASGGKIDAEAVLKRFATRVGYSYIATSFIQTTAMRELTVFLNGGEVFSANGKSFIRTASGGDIATTAQSFTGQDGKVYYKGTNSKGQEVTYSEAELQLGGYGGAVISGLINFGVQAGFEGSDWDSDDYIKNANDNQKYDLELVG